ncbi:hypothetical protein [Methylomonas sp. 11b]|uniref:hypothetical protein n=2 Tax=unclassified Methylomonas TaxID=2608980 RepID=UPI001E34C4E5|nr:hypothetical protein [Methylomonas sp. 11b]
MMSSSLSNRFKGRATIQQSNVHSVFSGHHATVHCHDCKRSMVPRVVTYYGQPLKSICPFCGSTFASFPSGFTRFIQSRYSDVLSFLVLQKLVTITICLVVLWFVADWGNLPDNISLFAAFGTVFFLALILAELVFQGVERMAAKFLHQSNYYWAILVLVSMFIAHEFPALAGYVALFFFMIIARGFVAVFILAWKKPVKSTFQ